MQVLNGSKFSINLHCSFLNIDRFCVVAGILVGMVEIINLTQYLIGLLKFLSSCSFNSLKNVFFRKNESFTDITSYVQIGTYERRISG